MTELCTDRLALRHWRATDQAPFAALNADPATMEFLPIVHNRAGGDLIRRGFTLLNQRARKSQRHLRIRQLLVLSPLEYLQDAPKAGVLARRRLSPETQGYLESLVE